MLFRSSSKLGILCHYHALAPSPQHAPLAVLYGLLNPVAHGIRRGVQQAGCARGSPWLPGGVAVPPAWHAWPAGVHRDRWRSSEVLSERRQANQHIGEARLRHTRGHAKDSSDCIAYVIDICPNEHFVLHCSRNRWLFY